MEARSGFSEKKVLKVFLYFRGNYSAASISLVGDYLIPKYENE
jgi:hypothetical protein